MDGEKAKEKIKNEKVLSCRGFYRREWRLLIKTGKFTIRSFSFIFIRHENHQDLFSKFNKYLNFHSNLQSCILNYNNSPPLFLHKSTRQFVSSRHKNLLNSYWTETVLIKNCPYNATMRDHLPTFWGLEELLFHSLRKNLGLMRATNWIGPLTRWSSWGGFT